MAKPVLEEAAQSAGRAHDSPARRCVRVFARDCRGRHADKNFSYSLCTDTPKKREVSQQRISYQCAT